MSSRRMVAAAGWRYHKNGAPSKVLQFEKYRLPFDRSGSDVVVKMLAAPVHKQDKNIIEGSYPITKSGLPQVGGLEGVGVVEDVGTSATRGLREGDLVWINNQSVGTWATHIVTNSENLDVLPTRADIDLEYLASMSLFHTAHHLVNNFVKIQPGDVVLQTGASGAVSQICQGYVRSRGGKLFQTLRVGRNDWHRQVNYYKSQGAYAVVTPEYARSNYMRRLLSDLPAPKLLLNHSGGITASSMVKLLGNNGTCVTYGNASGKPMQVAAVDTITRNLTFKNFFLPSFNAQQSREARMRVHQNVIEDLSLTAGAGTFRAERYRMDDKDSHFAFLTAFESPYSKRKPILRMVGEYGEWRRPTNEYIAHQMTTHVWEDILQQMQESSGHSDQPQSMKYYTPFGDIFSEFYRATESRELGMREVFFKRPNVPRHNATETK